MWRCEWIWQTYCCGDGHVLYLRAGDQDLVVLFLWLLLLPVESAASRQGEGNQRQEDGQDR